MRKKNLPNIQKGQKTPKQTGGGSLGRESRAHKPRSSETQVNEEGHVTNMVSQVGTRDTKLLHSL